MTMPGCFGDEARRPHDGDAGLGEVMSDEEIPRSSLSSSTATSLPPETAAAWQRLAAEPGQIEEHSPSTDTSKTI